MQVQGAAIRTGRVGTIVMETLTVALVFAVTWFTGGLVLAISIGSGVAVAVFASDLASRTCGHKPEPAAGPTGPPAPSATHEGG